MKSKELKNYNLPDNRTYNDAIEAKPRELLLALVAIGLVCVLFQYFLIGGSLAVFALACLIFLPSRKLIEFYDDHMILYNKARKDECNIVYYEDVKKWEYKTNISMDELLITLNDDSIQKVDGFSRIEYENKINVYLREKKVVSENRSNRLRNSK